MKESKFVGENSEKWEELESIINQNDKNPDKLSDLFVQLTDDLSYAQTFYKNRSIRVYLNGLTQKIFAKIQKKPRFRFSAIGNFFKEDVPRLMYTGRKEMFLALGVFLLALLIGVFSSRNDPQFANLVLGDYYVEMTKRNIENNDPMAVYRGGTEIQSFFQILINNARIDLIVFASGLLFSVFSTLILMKNGIMVGTFQYFFYAYGGLSTSVATIWLHGTIEISTLILVGGAGLMAGKGLIFPGTYNRFQGFRISATRGVKLLMAILPFTVLAAFIESFITRMGMPSLIKVMFILLSLGLVVFYFIIYPYRKFAKKEKVHKEEENYIPARAERSVQVNKIKGVGELVMDTVHLYRKNFGKIILIALAATVVYQLVVREFFPDFANIFVFTTKIEVLQDIISFFGLKLLHLKAYLFQSNPSYFRFLALLFALAAGAYHFLISKMSLFDISRPKRLILSGLIVVYAFVVFHIFRNYNLFLNITFGILCLVASIAAVSPFYKPNPVEGVRVSSWVLFRKGFGKILGLGLIFTVFGFLTMVLAASPISFFNQIFIQELVHISPEKMNVVTDIFILGLNVLVLFALLPLFGIGAMLWRNSMVEQCYAPELTKSIKKQFKL
jgi:uncharacterized membrane protein SpoIIM required for sporulation